MRAVFVRHLAADIAPGICYGRRDVGLTAAALRALPAFALELCAHAPRCVWTSPSRRCRLLADAVGAAAGGRVIESGGLLEMDFGDWEGLAWDEVPRAALDRWAADPADFAAPGGETGRAFAKRVAAAWADIRASGEDCVVVTHGGPLRLLPALAGGDTPDLLAPAPAIGSVTVVEC